MHIVEVLTEPAVSRGNGSAWPGLHTELMRRADGALLAVICASLLLEDLSRAVGAA